jgi:hypothetical protein
MAAKSVTGAKKCRNLRHWVSTMAAKSEANKWRCLPHFLRQFLRQSQLSTLVAESVTGAESDAKKCFKKILKTGANCVTFCYILDHYSFNSQRIQPKSF